MYMCIYTNVYTHIERRLALVCALCYNISHSTGRLLKKIGLFCKRAL